MISRMVGPMASEGVPYIPEAAKTLQTRAELRLLPVPKILDPIALQVDGKTPVRLTNFHLPCGGELFLGYHDLSATLGYLSWKPEFYASPQGDAAPLSRCPHCRRVINREQIAAQMPLSDTWSGPNQVEEIADEAVTYRVLVEHGIFWERRGIPLSGTFTVRPAELSPAARGHIRKQLIENRILEVRREA